MKPSKFFELLNHFVMSKDATQLLSLSNNLEVFSSKTLGSGELVTGENAPKAFRKAVNSYANSQKSIKLDVVSLTEIDTGGVICIKVKSGKSDYVSPFSLVLNKEQLIAFVE